MIKTILDRKADAVIARFGYEHENTILFCGLVETYLVQPDPIVLGIVLDECDRIMGIQYA